MPLNILFEKAWQRKDYFLKLIASVERFEVSGKSKKVLKETILGFMKKLPQNETTMEIRNRLEKLLESKPSFFDRILAKGFRR